MSALVTQTATPLANVPDLGEGVIEKLSEAGIASVEALADMTPEQLEAIPGIGPKTVEKISIAVNNYFASLEGDENVAEFAGEEALPAEGQSESSVELAAQDESAGVEGSEQAPSNEAAPGVAADEAQAVAAAESNESGNTGGDTETASLEPEPEAPSTAGNSEDSST